jgi:hypothetical protein
MHPSDVAIETVTLKCGDTYFVAECNGKRIAKKVLAGTSEEKKQRAIKHLHLDVYHALYGANGIVEYGNKHFGNYYDVPKRGC